MVSLLSHIRELQDAITAFQDDPGPSVARHKLIPAANALIAHLQSVPNSELSSDHPDAGVINWDAVHGELFSSYSLDWGGDLLVRCSRGETNMTVTVATRSSGEISDVEDLLAVVEAHDREYHQSKKH